MEQVPQDMQCYPDNRSTKSNSYDKFNKQKANHKEETNTMETTSAAEAEQALSSLRHSTVSTNLRDETIYDTKLLSHVSLQIKI